MDETPEPSTPKASPQPASIGRVVHFRDVDGQISAAIITRICQEDRVDLVTFGTNTLSWHIDVGFDGTDQGLVNCWSWPPRIGE